MAKIQVNLKLIMTVLFALACGVVAFLYPNWRTDLQAYTYYGYGGYGPRAYVTGAEGVKVVDLDTNLVVGSIGIGSKGGIAISSKGYAYVASCYPLCGVILVIDTATDEVVESISTSGYAGWGPEGIAVSPDGGYVYVTNYDDKSISVIDADSNTVVRNIALGFNPIGIAVHPLGKRLCVANMQNTVSVINTNTYNVIYPPVSVGLRPYGIVVRPDGKFVVALGINGIPGG